MHSISRLALALVALLLSTDSISAYSVGPRSSAARQTSSSSLPAAFVGESDSRLFYRDANDEDAPYTTQLPLNRASRDVSPSQVLLQAGVKLHDLPRHSADEETALMKFEMLLGRTAMIAAVVIAAMELSTGMSLPEHLGL